MKTVKKVHGICLVMMILLMLPAFGSNCWAALYSGYVGNRTDGSGAVLDTAGGMSATGNAWAVTGNTKTNKGVRLDWTVDPSGGNWVYTYTFIMPLGTSGAQKDIKNFDLQVANDFSASDLVSSVVSVPASGVSGPTPGVTLPAGISENSGLLLSPTVKSITKGYQWNFINIADYTFTMTVTTTRAPVWGDFIVSSSEVTATDNLTAYNTGFGAAKAAFPSIGGIYDGQVAVPGGPAPNVAPVLVTNSGITLGQGSGQTTITNATLRLTDTDTPAASLVYTLTAIPAMGALSNNGTPLSVSATFTQADVDSNLISYTPTGLQNGADGFSFTYSDGIATAQGPATFPVNVMPINEPLTVTFAGSGGGNVNSSPTGIACSGPPCSAPFPTGQQVTLVAGADKTSTFAGWGGDCNIDLNGNCKVTMDAIRAATATFTAAPHVMGGAVPYLTLQSAFDAANDPISALAITYSESLLYNRPGISLQFFGGFDGSYTTENGATTVKGSLSIKDGTLKVRNIAVQPAAPAKPSGIVASAGDGMVTVSWNAVTGATSYNIYYGTTAGVTTSTGTKVADVTSPQVISGLTNGTVYFFVVTAVGAGGESAPSSEKTATPAAAPPPPGNPTGVVVTPGIGQASVSWGTVAAATSYNVYYLQSATNPTTTTVLSTGSKLSSATSPLVVSSLASGSTYWFSVTAVNAGGESGAQTNPKSALIQ